MTGAVVLMVGIAFACGDSDTTGPTQDTFDWSGTVAQGDAIEIKGIAGNIQATLATGSQVQVSATLESVEGHVEDVTIEVVTHADGVTICAVYPDVPGQHPTCAPPATRAA